MDPKYLKMPLTGGLNPALVESLRESVEGWLLEGGVDLSVRAAVMAVVEELATNTMEHGAATWLEVSMAWFKDGVLISLQDDGRAFDPSDQILGGELGQNVEKTTDRHLGLYMVQELSKKFKYYREAEGINRVVMEIPFRSPSRPGS